MPEPDATDRPKPGRLTRLLFRRQIAQSEAGWARTDAMVRRSKEAIENANALVRRMKADARRQLAKRGQTVWAFVSYPFDSEQTEAYARQVEGFLQALNVRVVTARLYEPRPIQEKVGDLLANPFDLIVLIVAGKGESAWTRDEIAAATAKGAFVVPLVERPLKFERGLLGDLERLEFDAGHIGDTFVALAEAVRFTRDRVVDRTDYEEEEPPEPQPD